MSRGNKNKTGDFKIFLGYYCKSIWCLEQHARHFIHEGSGDCNMAVKASC